MSTVEELLTRYGELETIAINAPDVTARKRAMDERINLYVIIQKEQQKSQNMERALAEAAARDTQQQFSRQNARNAVSQRIEKQITEIQDELAGLGVSNDPVKRKAISDRSAELIDRLGRVLGGAE